MRIKQILETTTAGSVATVAMPMMTQTRENTNVRGLKPVQQVMKGAKKKSPYANSITESRVTEDDLAEQDLIIVPGQGRLRRTGFVKHDMDQGEHEGHTLKNSLHTIARAASDLDQRLSTQSEFPEWVSEKIGAAKGMMVSVMDYLISSQEMQHGAMESTSGLAYEDSDGGEQMLEMAMGELRNIAKNCKQIHGMLKQGKQLDTWEYSYITVSNDHIGTVADVLATDSAEGVAEAFDLGDLRKAAASSRSPEDTQALKRNPNFGKLMQKSVDKHNKAVVKTKKDIGSRIADIGPGGKEYNVKTDAAWDAANKSVEEGWKSKLGAAALAGAAALGGGSAQAQSAPSGYDNLPSIVAHVTFRVGDNTVTKDINLGTEYQTPGRASAALENLLKSKGIKFFNYTLQRAPAQPPLVSKDEMDASNQEYQRQQDSNNLSNTPYSATGDEPARLQTDKGYTSSSRPGASIAYESKKTVTKNKKA
jgi:hypothetical protein